MGTPAREIKGVRSDRSRAERSAQRGPGLLLGAALLLLVSAVVLFQPPSVLAVLMGTVIGLLAVLRWPTESLIAAVLSRVLVDLLWWVEFSLAGVNFSELYTGAMGALLAVHLLTQFDKVQRQPLFVPILLFSGVLVVGALMAADLRTGIEYSMRYGLPLVLFLLVTSLLDERRLWLLLRAVLVVGTLPLLLSVYHLAQGNLLSFVRLDYGRLSGAYGALHTHGHMMVLLGSFGMVSLSLVRRGRTRLVLGLYLLLAMVNLYYSHVRTAQLALVAFVVVYLLAGRRSGTLLLLTAVGVVLLLFSDTLQEGLSDIPSFFLYDPVATDVNALGSGRIAIWRTSVARFFGGPPHTWLLGLGLGQQVYLSPSGSLDTHSDFLGLLLQTGFIGLLVYLYLLLLGIQKSMDLLRRPRDERQAVFARAALGLFAAMMLSNAISNAYLNRVTPSWLLWTIIAGVFIMARERPPAEGQASPIRRPDLPSQPRPARRAQ